MAISLWSLHNGNLKLHHKKLDEGVVKIVVLGEPRVGKTSFIRAFYDHHEPGEIDSHNGVRWYACEFTLNNHHGRTAIFEIPGSHSFNLGNKAPHYEDANVIVFMYAIDDPSSLERLMDWWIDEAEFAINTKKMPLVLIGNKKDLRDDPQVIHELALLGKHPVTYEQARERFQHEELSYFAEISTTNLEEVNTAFRHIFTSEAIAAMDVPQC